MALSRRSRVLDSLFVLSVLIGVSDAYWVATEIGSSARSLVLVAALVVVVAAWVWRRRGAQDRRPSILLLVATAAASSVGDGAMLLPLMLVAILVAVLDLGVAAGAGFAASTVVLLAAIMTFAYRVPIVSVLLQSLGTALLLAFGLAYAAVVRQAEQARIEREEVLAQLDDAVARLQQANESLQRSAAAERDLMLAQERARSARELHDGLGHRLTVVTMSLDFAERMRERDPERAWSEIRAAREMSAEAIREMRMWVRAMHPADLTDLTDLGAFDAIAEAFRGTGLDVNVELTGDQRPLPQEVSLLCHRVVQEGLTNALRHAHASRVDINLDFDLDGLRIALHDNGVGFSSDRMTEGFGLRSLRERAEVLGGHASIQTLGHGATLLVEVPTTAPAELRV